MLPPEWQDVRRILVVRLDNIGDVVMLGPALRTLRMNLPTATITLMASPAGSQVAALLPWVDDVLVHRALWQDASGTMPLDPAREQALIADIRARDYDAAIIFTSFSQSPYPPAYVAYLAGISLRLGQSKEFGGGVLSHWVKSGSDAMHQVDRNLFLLQSIGFPVAERHLELVVPDEVQARSKRHLYHLGIDPTQPFIVLAPGASCGARRYDLSRYAAVAQILAAEIPIVLVGSSREIELVQPILAVANPYPIVSLVGQTSVPELAAVIRQASLVVANDSGPMHIADAFERPMVILFSGTDLESQWQPRNALTKLLRRTTDCSPCYAFYCPDQMECLDIPPAEVAMECLNLLQAEELVVSPINAGARGGGP